MPQLEEYFGRPLFQRYVRRVVLTEEAAVLAGALQKSLDAIEAAVVDYSNTSPRPCITLGAGPIFASRWLVPRLGEFWSQFPDTDLRLYHSSIPVERQLSRCDLAVAWGADSAC